ncbi:MAG: transglutaminase family protein [Propionicimonas sp.]
MVTLRPDSATDAYLDGSAVVDLDHPDVRATHAELVRNVADPVAAARTIYGFVRDQIRHSLDAGDRQVALSASDVLRHRTGLCYAKSHLAAALFRRSGIPAGLCYQLLQDGDRLVLHGLVAVHLAGGWHRLDVRGNKPGVTAEFSLEAEDLAFDLDPARGEVDLPDLLADAAPSVVEALRRGDDVRRIELPAGLGS